MQNIVLIVVDTLRPDHLGCYGYHRPTSPCLDALAERGTVLESLWSASNFTAPAFTSLFTGLYPHQHGVFDFTAQAPSSAIHDVFTHNKVRQGAVVSFRFFGNLLRKIWGEVEAVTDTRSFDYSKDLPQAVTESSLAWLKKNGRDGPFCLFCHYVGPHLPFRLPDQYATVFDTVSPAAVDPDFGRQFFPQDQEQLNNRKDPTTDSMFKLLEDINWKRRQVSPEGLQWLQDKYDASILYNDRAIGDLLAGLDEMDLADDTIVAVLSDHGEEFLEHGAISHGGIHLHEEIIKTVGIVYNPGGPAGNRISRPLSQVDMMPSLCRMAGAVDTPAAWDQRSFADLLTDGTHIRPDNTPIFCHGKFKIAMRAGNRKYIKTRPSGVLKPLARLKLMAKMLLRREAGSEIYDLGSDPGERHNLIGQRHLRRELDLLLKGHLADHTGELAANSVDDAERQRIEQEMKDLGYM